jgi:hypothetical protein
MAILYYPKGNLVGARDSANPGYEQIIIANSPATVFYFDTGSGISAVTASMLLITASYSTTSSWTFASISASSANQAVSAISSSWSSASFSSSYSQTSQTSSYSIGLVPVGSVIAWLTSFANIPVMPPEFVACNGQTESSSLSPFSGSVIPNLNGASAGTKRFLRGSTTSGTVSGSESHSHRLVSGGTCYCAGGIASFDINTATTLNLPSYYEVTWIFRRY